MQYDTLSWGMGFGVHIRHGLGMVPFRFGVYLAAEYLLEFYSVVRILFFAGKKEVEAFLYGAVCRCSDFSGNGDFYAGQSHPLWSFDITWQ